MDVKTCETVLQKILLIAQKPHTNIYIPLSELEIEFGLPCNEAQSSLQELQHMGLIKVTFFGDVQIYVLPEAFGYFKQKQETKKKDLKYKLEKYSWDIVKIALGSLLTLLVQWTMRKFF